MLAEIETALSEDIGVGPGITALAFFEEQNLVTGATALILRRLIGRERYSAPLAELPSVSGRQDQQGIDQFDATRDIALRRASISEFTRRFPSATRRTWPSRWSARTTRAIATSTSRASW